MNEKGVSWEWFRGGFKPSQTFTRALEQQQYQAHL